MRRKEREIGDRAEILAVIGRAQFADLAFICDGTPAIVPLSFGFREESGAIVFYFHSALEGRKIEALKRNPRAALAVVGENRVELNTPACRSTCFYESVIAEGEVEFLTELAARKSALDCLMSCHGMAGAMEYVPAVLEHTAVFRLTAKRINGKSNITRPQAAGI